MSITVDTITDEQIKALLGQLLRVKRKNAHHRSAIQDLRAALQGSRPCREIAAHWWNRFQSEWSAFLDTRASAKDPK